MIDRFSERHDAPRTNFDNFLKAMLAVFQVREVLLLTYTLNLFQFTSHFS